MTGFKSGVFDFKAIHKIAGDPFYASREIKPYVQPEPNRKCTIDPGKCSAEFNPNTKTWSTGCTGRCQDC